jgi:MFS family permease
MVMGPIFDTFGRKIPIVLGFIATGFVIIVIPMCNTIFPAFLILRCVLSLGASIGLNCPLLPDYVQNGSMGLANGYG